MSQYKVQRWKKINIVPIIKNGDIILRAGNGLWSELFQEFSPQDKRFSHVGIVCIENNKITVLHAEGNDLTGTGYVKFITLKEFVQSAKTTGISWLKKVYQKNFIKAAKKIFAPTI